MRTRDFGRLGQVSALTLGGGGIGAVWGETSRAEAVATVHAALDAGITLVDVAPSYGPDFEAERVAAEALRGRDVLLATKAQIHDDEFPDPVARMIESLEASLRRLGRDSVDMFLLHTQLRPAGTTGPRGTLDYDRYATEVAPAFDRLRADGKIRSWGLTAVGHPQSILDAIGDATHRPDYAQVIVNALDMNGDMWIYDDVPPRNADIVAAANTAGVPVIAIRAVAAGSLASTLDRPTAPGHPAAVDFARAEPFRKLAAELGESPAALAHRWTLTTPGVATVVLGVKNRTELAECVAAESRGPLTDAEMTAIAALRA
ncbi:aryl-alcohol dehydrogenase-like predicted oxidoreductase [Catenuloplanes nepalensis]|uniref:Aryl-alcohol dehydrogenase-like predicted oxidoreductase n=1 Tax=Catenuloplanes nepalensis TaxID=587533 RepID=A0ABT9MVT0_9ACTN|nr:aldo/keto reductase [Catenuloplanes nepalensis]MDP9795552.1 aryl-alcohol dehydrogenase-like predicted oxidoreductase [Catenuloplanes nepalensis]